MASLIAYTAFDYKNIIEADDGNSKPVHTSTQMVLLDTTAYGQKFKATVDGTSFKYDNQWNLKSGVLTKLTTQLDGKTYYTLSGASYELNNDYYDSGYVVDGVRLYGFTAEFAAILKGSDKLQGSAAKDKLAGFAGNDTIYGNGGDDVLEGWSGNDIYCQLGRTDRGIRHRRKRRCRAHHGRQQTAEHRTDLDSGREEPQYARRPV